MLNQKKRSSCRSSSLLRLLRASFDADDTPCDISYAHGRVEDGQPLAGLCAEAHGERAVFRLVLDGEQPIDQRSEEHTSELQSLMRISYAGFCLKKNNIHTDKHR